MVISPDKDYGPNSETTNSNNLSNFDSDTSLSEWASRSSGTNFFIDVVEWPMCSSWRHKMQASWFFVLMHSCSKHMAATIYPLWLYLLAQQNILLSHQKEYHGVIYERPHKKIKKKNTWQVWGRTLSIKKQSCHTWRSQPHRIFYFQRSHSILL